MGSSTGLLRAVADVVQQPPADGIRRVAVDGVDGAGKTTFAAALAGQLRGQDDVVDSTTPSIDDSRQRSAWLG